MIWLLAALAGMSLGLLIREIYDHALTTARFWEHVQELEADKRALTESLCRAQGKPYISNEKREFRPSEGWFDGQPRIEVKN